MKVLKTALILIGIIYSFNSYAQDVTTVEAKSDDISKNLDLKAVASVFGESEDLEDFEKRLNDPEAQITNLDMNGDSIVDYLRVMETVKDETHYVAIQAVVGEDEYQDVASIEIEKDDKGETTVQVVGDVYMYGPDYIYQPVYVSPPVIYVVFWGPRYNPYRSPWYWHHHPPHYHPWHPHPHHHYHSNVNVRINVNNSYNRTNVRVSNNSVNIQKSTRKNDYGSKNTSNSYENRNKGVSTANNKATTQQKSKVNSANKVDGDWKPKEGYSNGDVKTKQPDWSKSDKVNKAGDTTNKSNISNQGKTNNQSLNKSKTQQKVSKPATMPSSKRRANKR